MDWSTDISAAPRGERERVWLASKCGKVVLSEWHWPRKIGKYGTAMTKARWSMLGTDERPLAWRPYTAGEFPSHLGPETKRLVYPNGKGPQYPAALLGATAGRVD